MTSIDERARTAAADLRQRAADRPVAEIGVDGTSPSRRRWVPAAAAAVIALFIGAIAFGALDRGDDDVEVIAAPTSAPAGIEPTPWIRDELGLSLQVPDDWHDTGPRAGFTSSISGEPMDGYVLATLVPDHPGRDLEGFATARRAQLSRDLDLEVGESSEAVVDGRPASVWDYRLRMDGREAVVTEYIIDTGGQDRLVVVVGELAPAEQGDLRAWIGSTIQVEPVAAPVSAVEHPEPGDPPVGITPVSWSPPAVGVSMELPEDWAPGAPFPTSAPYAMSAPGEGPRPFLLAARLHAGDGDPAARAEARAAEGGALEASAEVVVDGRPATVSRWRMPVDDGAAAIQVEYLIELEDGSYAVVTVGYHPAIDHDVPDWIRSTISVTS